MRAVYHLLLPLECRVRVRYHRGVLVDATPVFLDALHLNVISRLVIVREYNYFLTILGRHQCTAVAHIRHIAGVVNNDDDNGAGAGAIELPDVFHLLLCKFQE